MSDRQLFDSASAIPKGRYQARVILDRTPTGSGPASFKSGNPTPLGRFTRGGAFQIERGGEALRTAQGMGMKTAPMAMTMSNWRKAHKAGMIAGGGSVANFARRAEISRFGGPAAVMLHVDMTDMWNLARGFNGIAVAIRQGHGIIAKAINDGLRTLKTGVRRKLQTWTGIKSYAETERGMTLTHATPATMTGQLRITDRHRRIGPNFAAAWARANPGGTHKAWNRSQLAPGSFMGPNGVLFKREGRGRLPIAPLWGPNMAREIERHEAEVRADVVVVAETKVKATAVRLMRAAIARAR